MESPARRKRLLITGATGFVGGHLSAALSDSEWDVVKATRDTDRAAQPGWIHIDVEDPATIEPALSGCDAAVYLIHSIDASANYPEREAKSALAFREAAENAGVARVVYLGGVAPAGAPSRHLQSRLRTGEILREGDVSTIELRAALIVGAGGSSWMMVRDLAARLPAMLLPRWLKFSSWPIGIEDVVVAIVRALDHPQEGSAWYDLPGPQRMTHEALLGEVAECMGKNPSLVGVPVITPRLSSYWIALVTRANLALAQELVEGLQSDLDPSGTVFWDVAAGCAPSSFQSTVVRAIADEQAPEIPTPTLVECIQRRLKGLG